MPNTDPRAAVRKTSAPLPFFSCGADTALFSVNTGVSFDALLDNAQTFMVSVEAAVLNAAEETDTPATWGAYYLAQMAGALLESLQQEMLEGRRHD